MFEISQYEFGCETHEEHKISIRKTAETHHVPFESFHKEYHSLEHQSGIWHILIYYIEIIATKFALQTLSVK